MPIAFAGGGLFTAALRRSTLAATVAITLLPMAEASAQDIGVRSAQLGISKAGSSLQGFGAKPRAQLQDIETPDDSGWSVGVKGALIGGLVGASVVVIYGLGICQEPNCPPPVSDFAIPVVVAAGVGAGVGYLIEHAVAKARRR